MMALKDIGTCILMILPPSKIKNRLLTFIGHEVENNSQIGITIALHIRLLTFEENTTLGNFNVIRNLNHLKMHNGAHIGNLNWISAAEEFATTATNAMLIMQPSSVITNRHYLDVSGTLEMMPRSALWGVRSTLITHGIDPKSWTQIATKTVIGERSVIGSNSAIVPGTAIPDGCYFGMGSLISGKKYKAKTKYINQKAKPL